MHHMMPAGTEVLDMQVCLDNEVMSLHDLTAVVLQSVKLRQIHKDIVEVIRMHSTS